MTALRILAARVKAFLTRGRRDAELDEEIEAHLALLTEDYQRGGLPPDQARAAARRAFGGLEPMKDSYRDQRGLPFLDALAQDLRYGARMLRRDPGFTAVVVLSLALGIGAATAVFSVFNAVMLRPLAVPEPDRLVILQAERNGERWILFNPIFEELRREQRTLSGLFAESGEPFLRAVFDDAPAPVYIRAGLVSGAYFDVLGVRAARGRKLEPRDDEPAAACAAVISDRFWQHRFQSDPGVLGRTLRVRETTCTIVGVAPRGFEGHGPERAPDVWLPLRRLTEAKLLASRTMAFFSGVMGRLRPGVTLQQAEAELGGLYRRIPQPGAGEGDLRLRLLAGARGLDEQRRRYGEPLGLILAVTGALLLIASLNVATLLLARGAARLPELATRAALGAGRMRLLRQLATEGAATAVLGGLAGAALAWWGTPRLGAQISETLDTTADVRVIAAAVGATALTALLAGLVPALRLSRAAAPNERTRTATRGGQRLIRTLVAAQLALSLLLVSAASLLLRSLVRIDGVDLGFEPAHVVALYIADETPVDAPAKTRRAAVYRAAEERLRALPGVRAASLSWLGLFSRQNLSVDVVDADHPDRRGETRIDFVSAGYLETAGMSVVRGRGFTAEDREGAERVAVVNETMARERLGGAPLGRRLACQYPPEERTRPFTVVGVVRDSKYNEVRESHAQAMMWVPLAQAPHGISSVMLRVEPGFERAVARQAQATLAQTDPHLMVRRASTLSEHVARTAERERLLLGLASSFGGIALLLAAVGLYGTLAYAVARRTREIGVRLALGAETSKMLRMVLGDAARLVAGALVVGIPAALATGRTLRSFLFDVTPQDPMALGGACAVLALAALLAAYLPARRAASVDPAVALRAE
jgi:predicted permease